MICAFDTQTLIYALDPKDADKELRRRARLLIEDLTEQKAKIIIPTVVVSEWLTGIDKADHGRFLAELQSRFFTPPLDLRASELAADLFQRHHKLPTLQRTHRTVLRSDVYVVATAKVAGGGGPL